MGKKKLILKESEDLGELKKAKTAEYRIIDPENDCKEVKEINNKSKARGYNKETQHRLLSGRGGRGSRGSRGGRGRRGSRGGRCGQAKIGSIDDDEHGLKIYSISNEQYDHSDVESTETISSEVKMVKTTVTLTENEESDKNKFDKKEKHVTKNSSGSTSDTCESSGSDLDIEIMNKTVNLKNVKEKEAKRQQELADPSNEKDAAQMFEIS